VPFNSGLMSGHLAAPPIAPRYRVGCRRVVGAPTGNDGMAMLGQLAEAGETSPALHEVAVDVDLLLVGPTGLRRFPWRFRCAEMLSGRL
jgi:hypothetical protein